ncbi:MAG: GNAT family N-acetyltransferase [Pseudomonadota bacterium]
MTESPIMYKTRRLQVRHLRDGDASEMASVYGDADAMRYVDDGDILTLDECEAWVAKSLQNYARYGYGMSAVELADNGPVIGFIGGVHPNGQIDCEIKYAFRRDCWGLGYATEAVCGMVAYLHDSLRIRHFVATIDPENSASRRVLEKSGFAFSHNQLNADGSITETLVLSYHRV